MSGLRNLRDDGDIFDALDDDAEEKASKVASVADALAWECLYVVALVASSRARGRGPKNRGRDA
jgi:hypothetical protein